MAATDDRSRPVGGDSEALEGAIRQFEAAWTRGERPAITDALSGSGPARAKLLEELLHIDLEFRLKAGEAARAEDYQRDFAQVRADPALLLSLIRTEAAIRRRSESSLRLAHYRSRFAEFDGELEAALGDLGLAGESSPEEVQPDQPQLDSGAPGADRLGKYEFRRRLGSGEFGAVFLAWDTVLKREVAIKIPRPEVMHSPSDLLVFLREARNAIHLKHPNIVAIYDAGPIDGTACVVREFVAGTTLAGRLRSGPLEIAETVALITAVLEALDYAHRQGIVHRDLKPSNILLDEDGRPHLTDFGLAKRSTGDSTLSPAGAARVLIGTPAYMPPEQARGDARSVDDRSDLYSVGVVLYELLTGSVPFRGRGRLLQAQIEHAPPIPPRDLDEEIPLALESICLRALAKHPDQRYRSARDMADDLANFVAGRPVVGAGTLPTSTPSDASRPRRILLAAGAVLLLLGLLAAGVYRVVAAHRQQDARLLATLVDDIEALDSIALDQPAIGPEAVRDRRLRADAVRPRLEAILPLLAAHPELAARRVELLVRHADRIAALGDEGATRLAWRAAVAALEPVTSGPSAAPRRREELARGLMTLAEIEAEGGRVDRARRLAERSASLWDGLADERQPRRGPSDVRRSALLTRAMALLEADRAARLAQSDSPPTRIEEVEQVVSSPRDSEGWSPDELRGLVAIGRGLATRALEFGQPAEAARWAAVALELAEASATRPGEETARGQVARATALLALAEASAARESPPGSPTCRAVSERLQLAMIRLNDAFDQALSDLTLRRDLVEVGRALGELQLRTGALAHAVETLRQAQSWNRALILEGARAPELAQAARIKADLALADWDARRATIACARMALAALQMNQAERIAPGRSAYGSAFRTYTWATIQLLVGHRPATVDGPVTAPAFTTGSGTSRKDRSGPQLLGEPLPPEPTFRMAPRGWRTGSDGEGTGWPRERRP